MFSGSGNTEIRENTVEFKGVLEKNDGVHYPEIEMVYPNCKFNDISTANKPFSESVSNNSRHRRILLDK